MAVLLPSSGLAQTPCGSGTCPAGSFCSEIVPGQCILIGRVDCGTTSCNPGDQCVSGNQCVHSRAGREPEAVGSFGAIAIGQGGRWGAVANIDSIASAHGLALQNCQSTTCNIKADIPPGRCASVAKSNNNPEITIFNNEAPGLDISQSLALESCNSQFGDCAIRWSACNGS
jgi:hypothetical protein